MDEQLYLLAMGFSLDEKLEKSIQQLQHDVPRARARMLRDMIGGAIVAQGAAWAPQGRVLSI